MKYAVIIAMVTGLMAGCKKEGETPLPAVGHTGRNILACRINGQNYIVEGKNASKVTQYADYTGPYKSGGDSSFQITGKMVGDLEKTISITIPFSKATSTYILDSLNGQGTYKVLSVDVDKLYTANPVHAGYVLIQYTSADRILSGTFAFDATDNKTGEQVHITDGRFDIADY